MTFRETGPGPDLQNEALLSQVNKILRDAGITERAYSYSDELSLIEVEDISSDLQRRSPFNEQGITPRILVYFGGWIAPKGTEITFSPRQPRPIESEKDAGSTTDVSFTFSGLRFNEIDGLNGEIHHDELTEGKVVVRTQKGTMVWQTDGSKTTIPLVIFSRKLGANHCLEAVTSISLEEDRTQNVSSTPQVEQSRGMTDREAMSRLVETINSLPYHNEPTLGPGTKVCHAGDNVVEARIEIAGSQPRIKFNYEVDRNLLEGFLYGCENPNASLDFLRIKPGWVDKTQLFVNLDLRPNGKLEILVGEVDEEGEADMSQAIEISPRLLKRILDKTVPGYPNTPDTRRRPGTDVFEAARRIDSLHNEPRRQSRVSNFDAIRGLNRVFDNASLGSPITESTRYSRSAFEGGRDWKAEDRARKERAIAEVDAALKRQRAQEREELEPYVHYTPPPVRHETSHDKPGIVEPAEIRKEGNGSGRKLSYGQRHPENRKNGPGSIDRKHNKKRQIEGLKKEKNSKKGRNH